MIIFVGDKPSKKNIDPEVAFVGTKSYKTVLDWIYEMKIDVTHTVLCNKTDVKARAYGIEVNPANYGLDLHHEDRVIALGEEASKYLDKINVNHFKLPHPSGLNRKLNDKKWLKKELKKCYKWINQ